MSGVTMREGGFAFAKCGTNSWGVPASVLFGLHIESDGGMAQNPEFVDDQSFGQTFLGPAEVGNFPAQDLTWTTPAKFTDHAYRLIAGAMGSPAAVTLVTSTASAPTSWLHILDLAPSTDGVAWTGAFAKKIIVDELTSFKVTGFGLTGDGSVMKLSLKVMGTKSTNQSSVNINSTVFGANYPSLANRIFTKHGTFRTNLQSGNTLAAGDAIKIETCAFDFSRPQDAPNIYGQDFVDEPADNGFPDVSLNLTFPRADTISVNSFYAIHRDGTVLKGELRFTGAFINSTDNYSYVFQFPHLEVQATTQNTQGAQQIKPTAMLKAKKAFTSPSGMPFVNPFRLRITTTQSIAGLA